MTVQYLIDSENVGDFWIPLLELPGQDAELIVFYTRNSPHMGYDNLIRLKESNRTVTFVKCFEGTNALDFQLVSELGYRISKDEDGSFIIVTNDTGFDAAVKYWRHRKKSVKRISGKECRSLSRRLREDLSFRTPQGSSVNVSDPLFAETEHDEERDAQAEVFRAEAAPDNGARPSRPNLRDAERAAQPDPEEDFPETDSDYMTDAETGGADGDDAGPSAYDRADADADERAYEREEDGLLVDAAYDIEPQETGDDTAGDDTEETAVPEGSPDAGQNEGVSAEDETAAEEALAAEETPVGDEASAREKTPVREEADPGHIVSDDLRGSSETLNAADAAGNGGRENDTAENATEPVREGFSDALPVPGDDEVARIVSCIGTDNLAELHNQLATFYGDQGKAIYLSIKNNTRTLPALNPDLKHKFAYYCEIIFRRSDYADEYPSDISEYLLNVREKLNNLNSLRYALQKHYGKEKGRRFYFLLKPFARTMYQM